MIKWFVYIVLLLILKPCLLAAETTPFYSSFKDNLSPVSVIDTAAKTKPSKPDADNKKKVKELTNAKHLPRPEKIDGTKAATPAAAPPPPKAKTKRQRRPAGMERPPELPRRYGT